MGVKRKANKAERLHMGRVAEMGCIICQRPAEIHHLKSGGGSLRASHYDVLPLCHEHHRTGGHGVALHAGIETWQKNYGTEAELLEHVKELVGV